jgi:Putative Ig domain/Transglutaminase-like superfamily
MRFLAAFAVCACLCAQNRQDIRTVTVPRYEYTIQMGGTEDAANTRDPVVYAAWKPGFEPMRSVRLENTGDTDVVNPWILVNGKGDWRTTASIAEEALRSYGDPAAMSDAEKARAIWEFVRRRRFHATTGDLEVRDPVKMLNVYGYALCGDNAAVLMELWRTVGLPARRAYPIAHCVSEAWYDGGWHMLDGDESVLFLDRDNHTILPENAVAQDHDLSKRAYQSEYLPALYDYGGTHQGAFPEHSGHTMDFTLRPGESMEWRWGQGTGFHYAPNPVIYLLDSADLHRWGPNAWATLRNGVWGYAPPLDRPAGHRALEAVNVRWGSNGASPTAAHTPATLVWKIRTPYVILGGRLNARFLSRPGDRFSFSASFDGRNWQPVPADSLDFLFPSPGPPRYEYFLKLDMESAGDPGRLVLAALSIENDLQMAPLAMPSLSLGTNQIQFTDEAPGSRNVKLEFNWVERGVSQPPDAPTRPVFPPNSGSIEGTRPNFEWSEVAGAATYHFELSEEPAMRWALSPAFETVQPGNTFRQLSVGLLNPGQTYYWRVRAKSREGIWGPWSAVWRFTPNGPAEPVHVRFEERGPGQLTLAWDAGASGRRPVRYRIYGSDEQGFTTSDEPYDVATGNQKTAGLFPGESDVRFPANFVAETTATVLSLAPRHAFYRVVALDERGNRSGSSAYAEAPRPWIYTEPERAAKVGVPYRYEAKTIGSIGDLTYHHVFPDGQSQAAFWDADEPVFSLDSEMSRCGNFDPKWLHIDPKTGVVSGTPGEADSGEYEVNVRVVIQGKAHVQSYPLRVVR